jgi:ABC-type nickel/cobalt efflux system permease component RcnA
MYFMKTDSRSPLSFTVWACILRTHTHTHNHTHTHTQAHTHRLTHTQAHTHMHTHTHTHTHSHTHTLSQVIASSAVVTGVDFDLSYVAGSVVPPFSLLAN